MSGDDVSYCPSFRNSGIMTKAMENASVVESMSQTSKTCPDNLSVVGSHFCLNTEDRNDETANIFRCNLRCLHDSNNQSKIVQRQCTQLGDPTCKFAGLNCQVFAVEEGKSEEEANITPPLTTTNHAESSCESSNPTKDSIMTTAFKKTQLMREMHEGAISNGKKSSFYNFPEIVEFGAEPRIKKFLLPPSMNEDERKKFSEMLIEDMPMITSLHDKCCSSVLKNEFSPTTTWARKEIENIGMILGSMETDSEYDPLTTCPGKDKIPIKNTCPNL